MPKRAVNRRNCRQNYWRVDRGKTLIDADAACAVSKSLPHGHAALVHAAAGQLGLPAVLGLAGRERDLAYALIISRVLRPTPKLSTRAWWNDVTLGPDLDVAGASRNEVYAAMDWLLGRQDAIEATLAGRHLSTGGMAMFDLSSSWVEGSHCELAARGYSRDAKKGTLQIEYGLLTDPDGRPVAIRVFPGNTADPTAFINAVDIVRDKFGLAELTLVGDRGMITSPPMTGRCSCRCSTNRTSPKSAAPTTPASVSSRAATPTWPSYGRSNARACCAPPKPCWALSPPGYRPGDCPVPTRLAWRSARSSISTRWPNTST